MEAQLKKKKNEYDIRWKKRKKETKHSTSYIKTKRTITKKMVAGQAAPNDYGKTLTDEEEKKNPKPKWYTSHTQNRQPPTMVSFLSFYSTRGKTVYKSETKISPLIQWGYFP